MEGKETVHDVMMFACLLTERREGDVRRYQENASDVIKTSCNLNS